MLHVRVIAPLWSVLILLSQAVVDGATCDGVTVTAPVSLRDPTGWDSQDIGAGQRRQGHVSAEIIAWGQEHIVVYGGTSLRNDDVNDVLGEETSVSILDMSNPQKNWTELEMAGESAMAVPPWIPSQFNLYAASPEIPISLKNRVYSVRATCWRIPGQRM